MILSLLAGANRSGSNLHKRGRLLLLLPPLLPTSPESPPGVGPEGGVVVETPDGGEHPGALGTTAVVYHPHRPHSGTTDSISYFNMTTITWGMVLPHMVVVLLAQRPMCRGMGG